MKSRIPFGLAAVAALAMVSCGGVVDPSQNITENFSGTLQPLSSSTYAVQTFTYHVGKSGEYSLAVDSVSPAIPSNSIGLAFGQVISGSCVALGAGAVTIGRTAYASAIQPGDYCVQVYDPGFLTQAVNFQGTFKHP